MVRMTKQQLVETAILVLEHQGLHRDIFFDVNAFFLGGVQSVGAQVSVWHELPDNKTRERAKREFQEATNGAVLNIY